jgi:hypothetical protein
VLAAEPVLAKPSTGCGVYVRREALPISQASRSSELRGSGWASSAARVASGVHLAVSEVHDRGEVAAGQLHALKAVVVEGAQPGA